MILNYKLGKYIKFTKKMFDEEELFNWRAGMGDIDGIYCLECGDQITVGYSWNGLCVVCAETYLNMETQPDER